MHVLVAMVATFGWPCRGAHLVLHSALCCANSSVLFLDRG